MGSFMSSLLTQQFIREHGLNELKSRYKIKTCFHPHDPIVILNYTNQFSKNVHPIEDECRGLVLELDTWNVVAKPFTRFYQTGVKRQLEDIDFSKCVVQSKEDGSLVILYNYRGAWRINCIQNFGQDLVGESKMTYQQLFEHIIGHKLEDFPSVFSTLNPNCTYLFEMCTVFNRVVKLYIPSKLFLLTIVHRDTESLMFIEEDMEICNQTSEILGTCRPQVFDFKTKKEMIKYLQVMQTNIENMTFEGFVINYFPNSTNAHIKERFKLKNLTYILLHRLRYRDYAAATPKNVMHFIKNSNLWDKFLDTIQEFGLNCNEIMYKIMIIKENMSNTKCSHKMIKAMDERYHPDKRYCSIESSYGVEQLEQICDDNDYMSRICKPVFDGFSWDVRCPCKITTDLLNNKESKKSFDPSFLSKMELIRLKKDHLVPSPCHCSQMYIEKPHDIMKSIRVSDYYIKTGKLVWICPDCNNTHEAHQQDVIYEDEGIPHREGDPLGIPSSRLCKMFRLHVHSLFDPLWKNGKMSRNEAYHFLANNLGLKREDAHIATFSIRQCIASIRFLRNID